MKIRAQYPEYSNNSLSNSRKNPQRIGFEGNPVASETPRIDRILQKPFVQDIFKKASNNSHLIQVLSIGVLGLALRPATLLVIPGAEKKDKQYVATKSIIGTALLVATQLLITIPLGKSLDKLAEIAKKNPKSAFNSYTPKQLKAYNFLISSVVGLVLTFATSSYLTVKLTTQIMTKLFPQKEESNTQKPKGKERVV